MAKELVSKITKQYNPEDLALEDTVLLQRADELVKNAYGIGQIVLHEGETGENPPPTGRQIVTQIVVYP